MLMRLMVSVVLGLGICAGGAADSLTSEGWVPLFDGQSLRGWKASENVGSFKVTDGQIAADGPRSHLFYVGEVQKGDFKNFELKAEVLAKPGANSGLYFHTAFQDRDWPRKGFEVQINNTQPRHGDYLELKKTGSLYGIRNVYKPLARDNEWFTLHIFVRGKHVQVRVNDLLVVDYTEPAAPVTLPGEEGRLLGRGTFALQCHDPESKAFFRNLRVKPLPDDAAASPAAEPLLDEASVQILKLAGENFPLVDFHVHLKGGLTLPEALALSRQTGINYGIAVNCGVGFAVTNDAGAERFLKTMAGQPVFVGMQAEGREWPTLFSPAAIARFDYVFSDAMTIVDHRGKRSRLWIKEEVDIPDKQAFMDRLVETIVGIMNHEPIDIYVNPTFLPEVIAKEYDLLWTRERVMKVIEAAARNRVAIEINSTYRLPKPGFIRLAKQAGVKFTLGTNNGGRNLGRCEYGLQMVRACGLTWKDMWMPRPEGEKPIQVRRR